jgi:4-amino-4-deoxychorismate lyase
MFQFFETIKLVNGILQFPELHQNRMNTTFNHFYGMDTPYTISDIKIPKEYKSGIVKFRFEYDYSGSKSEFSFYNKKLITSLKLIHCDSLDYSFKKTDRASIEKLLQLREDCDDIIIIKNGKVTDTSFSNVVLFDGIKWITPDEPLLNGTTRQRLIFENRIEAKPVLYCDLFKFKKLVLLNAMRGDDLIDSFPITAIK